MRRKSAKIIEETIIDGKISFRKFGQDVVFRSKAKPATNKALDSNFVSDFIDFKKHIFSEFAVLKAKVSQDQGPPIDDNERPSVRSELIQSLHGRIASLEKQLERQNQIIFKMIDTHQDSVREIVINEKSGLSINSAKIAVETKPKSSKDNTSSTQKQQQCPKDKKVDQQSGTHEAVTSNSKDDSVTSIENESQKTKMVSNKTRKSVIVIGDSLLNGIDDRGLCKHHNVKQGSSTSRCNN
eukprot:Seg485.1 transcript_id=Seg485.1/GoldUCD/mRNA.D3Y31 product="hypothetical protein" protein_id=Seg485.1/GoldUCD/D3Y31